MYLYCLFKAFSKIIFSSSLSEIASDKIFFDFSEILKLFKIFFISSKAFL